MVRPVTDPQLLAQLNAPTPTPTARPVTDPALLAQLNDTPQPSLSDDMRWDEKLLVGVGAAMDRAGRGVKGLVNSARDIAGSQPAFDPAALAQGADDARLYQANHPGGWATAGEIGGDVALSALPMGAAARGANLAANTMRAGTFARAAAPVAADVAANAGYAAATAPENRGEAAAWGAGGATAGRVLTRTLGGAIKPTPEAVDLISRGVRLTPGQSAGRGSFINSVEQSMTSVPGAGWAINQARARAIEDANVAAAQSVMDGVGSSVKLGRPPAEAIEQVRDHISKVYDEVLPSLSMGKRDLNSLVDQIIVNVPQDAPLVGKKQAAKLAEYLDRRVIDLDVAADADVTGHFLKQVDSELGSYARSLARSSNAEEKVASPMWYDAQQKWREYVMRAAAPTSDAYLTLGAANSAYRQLLSLEKALRASGGERINPRNLSKSLDSAGINSGDLYQISKSMNATLPGTVPDSGTAGRLAFQALPLTLGLGGAGMGIPALIGAGVGAAAFGTQTGTKALTGQLATQKYLSDLLRNKLKVSDPAMISSQLGRASATRGE